MQSRNVIAILLLIFLCISPLTPSFHFESINDLPPMLYDKAVQSDQNPIIIESNSDFETQGWSGNGSINNPYIIEDLQIVISEHGQSGITIRNVSSHFIIRNCSFSFDRGYFEQISGGTGVTIERTSNGRIINCTFTNLRDGIHAYDSRRFTITNCTFTSFTYQGKGINLRYSKEWIIANSTFMYNYIGIHLSFVNTTAVFDNTVLFNEIGVDLHPTFECNLTGNLIAYNTGIGVLLRYGGSLNRIFKNRIAFNQDEAIHEDVNAQDDGYDNLWDDNISIGNEWGDYSGTGEYEIPGSAGSIDRFPSVAEFDLAGPTFYHVTDYWVTAYPGICPFQSLGFHASVYDQSGVNTVLLYFSNTLGANWSWVEMEFQPTTEYPDAYSYSFEGSLYSLEFIRQYYFWANDTLGQVAGSGLYSNTLYCRNFTSPLPPSYPSNGSSSPSNGLSTTIVTIMSVGGIAVILALFILRKKGSGNQWTRIGYG